METLSSRFSAADCSAAQGIRLSGERVINRVDSFQSTSSSNPTGRTPPLPAKPEPEAINGASANHPMPEVGFEPQFVPNVPVGSPAYTDRCCTGSLS